MNALYNVARVRRLQNQFNWVTLALRVVAWSGPYTFDEYHTLTSQIAATATKRAHSLLLDGHTVTTGGYARANAAVIENLVAGGDPVTFLTLCEDTGDTSNMPLIAFYDTGIGLPFQPNGLDWLIQPDWIAERGYFRA